MTLLQREREARGLSLSEVARRAEMLTTKLWKLEHAQMRLKVDDVPRLARAIGCAPLALIPTEDGAAAGPEPPGPEAPCCGLTCTMTSPCPLAQPATEAATLVGAQEGTPTQHAQLVALRVKKLAAVYAALKARAHPLADPLRHTSRPAHDAAGHG